MYSITKLSCPSLRPEQVESLHAKGFINMADVLQQKPENIREAGNLTLEEYETLISNVVEFMTPTPTLASIALSEEDVKLHPTGISGLDRILGGGIAGGEVLEIYGESGIGRTQFCLAMCAQFCMSNSTVAYFNLSRDFTAKRLLQFCNDQRESLMNVQVIQPTNAEMLATEISNMSLSVANHETFYKKLKLVILDSFPMVIYPAVDDDKMSWRYCEEELIENLIKLSKLNDGIVIVLVNHAVKGRQPQNSTIRNPNVSSIAPAMGKYWKHKVNFRLRLEKTLNIPHDFSAELEKSSRTESNSKFNFMIGNDSINAFNKM